MFNIAIRMSRAKVLYTGTYRRGLLCDQVGCQLWNLLGYPEQMMRWLFGLVLARISASPHIPGA